MLASKWASTEALNIAILAILSVCADAERDAVAVCNSASVAKVSSNDPVNASIAVNLLSWAAPVVAKDELIASLFTSAEELKELILESKCVSTDALKTLILLTLSAWAEADSADMFASRWVSTDADKAEMLASKCVSTDALRLVIEDDILACRPLNPVVSWTVTWTDPDIVPSAVTPVNPEPSPTNDPVKEPDSWAPSWASIK